MYAERGPVIRHKACDEFDEVEIRHKACDVLGDLSAAVEKGDEFNRFSPFLSWSHYRTLTKIDHKNERLFYEIEAEKEGWSVPYLQKQINSFLFARLFKSKDKEGVMQLSRDLTRYIFFSISIIQDEQLSLNKYQKLKQGLMQDLLIGKKEVVTDPEDYKEVACA